MNKLILYCMFAFVFFKVEAYQIDLSEYGVNYQLLQVDNKTKTEIQVGDLAHALGLYYSYMPYKYSGHKYKSWQSTLGGDLVYIRDNSSFTQAVTGNNNNISNKSSNVLGYSVYLETGLSMRIKSVKSLQAGLMVGYKYNDINRTIFKCSDCNEESLDAFSHSSYLKPFVAFKISNVIKGKLYFSYYFQSSGFTNGLGLQISF